MRGMTLIVKTVTSLVSAFILLYGIYVVLYGHLSPGGGFPGGVILACCLILMVLAFGKKFVDDIVSERAPYLWDCVGALAFLGVALVGYYGGSFFYNFLVSPESHQGAAAAVAGNYRLFSSGIILPCNIAIGIKVAACLVGVFAVLSVFRPEPRSEDPTR
ncbi:MAG TPA: MnhB domain-containing protein [Planctomycetota bacterium]|nr:MnhB domain-containing protein [Planctomycetota bacterium]